MQSARDDNLFAAVQSGLSATAKRPHGLVLILTGDSPSGDEAMEAVRHRFGWPEINIGRELSQALLDIPAKRRPMEVGTILQQMVERRATPTVPALLFTRLELLFQPALKLDPIGVLLRLAQHRVIAAEWPGAWNAGKLSYAVPGHPEHQSWPRQAIEVIDLRSFITASAA